MSEKETRRFSFGWCVIIGIIHALVSVVISFAAFGTAMNAFSPTPGNIEKQLTDLELFSWIWMTGPMILSKLGNVSVEKGLSGYMLIYSIFVGIVAGYLIPFLRGRSRASRTKPV